MKFLVIFALTLVTVFGLPSKEIKPRNIVVPAGSPEGRITNGIDAQEKEIPYQVGMMQEHSNKRLTWCGGCIISKTTILTAAHCVEDVVSVKVIMGTIDRRAARVEHDVTEKNIIVHPGWNNRTLQNDIAIIRIPPIEYSDYIQPVKLPSYSEYSNYAGETAIASGWGRTSDTVAGPTTHLKYANMNIIPNNVCSQYYPIYTSNICISTKTGVSTCSGDSGGPLVVLSTNVLVGLTSFGSKVGCEKNLPIAFTRVTSFLDWIEQNSDVVI